MFKTSALLLTLGLAEASASKSSVALLDFDHHIPGDNAMWYASNDSATGGHSTIHGPLLWSDPGVGLYGVLLGKVTQVPGYDLAGFAKAGLVGRNGWKFPDVSDFINGSLVIECRDDYMRPGYGGNWYVALAARAADPSFACTAGGEEPKFPIPAPNGSRGCFKQNFTIPAPQGGADFGVAKIPFNTFSDKWNVASGRDTKECAEDKDVCLTAARLSEIQRIEIWAQGFPGPFQLEIKRISVEKASGEMMVLV